MTKKMNYKNKKVLILGLGLNQGGVGSACFFAKNGAKVLVTDIKTETELAPSLKKLKDFTNITYHLNGHKEEDIDWADLIIKNIAIKPGNKYIEYAKSKSKQIETDIGIFLQIVNPMQIIGITGTKGKTTTASLLYYALKEDPRLRGDDGGVVLAGNIGKSVLDALDQITPQTHVILEISSFQLQTFDEKKISPHIAVITNIMPDHLNYHRDMEEYIQAKRVIAKHQTQDDFLFINKDDPTITSEEFLKDLKANIDLISADDLPRDFKPTLIGKHNLISYRTALAVSKVLGIPGDEALNNMNQFKGADYRLQKIYEKDGIRIINDSASTNPEAGIAALKTYPNSILIAGGMNKGLEYQQFSKAIDEYAKEVYFLEGDVAEEIINNLEDLKSKILNHKPLYQDLAHLLEDLKSQIKSGDIILFSPGATSFNLFQNEFDRGKKFNEAVKKVFN